MPPGAAAHRIHRPRGSLSCLSQGAAEPASPDINVAWSGIVHGSTSSASRSSGYAILSAAAGHLGSQVRPQADRPRPHFSSFLLDLADPAPDSRIVLLGADGLELACELIRFGASDVSIARIADMPHDTRADIAIIPHAPTARLIEQSIVVARRSLHPLGRLIMGDVPTDLLGIARAHLRLHGFRRLQSWTELDRLALRAELPLRGGVSCA